MIKTTTLALAIAASASAASITQVEEFTSGTLEGFEDTNIDFSYGPQSIMGGLAEVFNTRSDKFIHASQGWVSSAQVSAHEGTHFLGSASYGIEYRFSTDQQSFGGYFASVSNSNVAGIRFFKGDTLVDQETFYTEDPGTWGWKGWSSTESFDRVQIEGRYNTQFGTYAGLLMHDSIRVHSAQVPSPGALALFLGAGITVTRRRRA